MRAALERTQSVELEMRVEGEEADERALAARQGVQRAPDGLARHRQHATAHRAGRHVQHKEISRWHRPPDLHCWAHNQYDENFNR